MYHKLLIAIFHVAVVAFQIGAIYLWVYVYNVVRISVEANLKELQINDSSVNKSTSKSSIAQPGSFTEPLLPPKDCVTSEEHAAALPYTRFDGKTQVVYYFRSLP